MDAGSRKEAYAASGHINGYGSIGAALTDVSVGFISVNLGWDAVFYFLMAGTGITVVLQLVIWNALGTN